MEAPAVAWVALVLGAVFLGIGLALLDQPPDRPQRTCGIESGPCVEADALRSGAGSMVAWAALGMALVMDVLFLGLTSGGRVLT